MTHAPLPELPKLQLLRLPGGTADWLMGGQYRVPLGSAPLRLMIDGASVHLTDGVSVRGASVEALILALRESFETVLFCWTVSGGEVVNRTLRLTLEEDALALTIEGPAGEHSLTLSDDQAQALAQALEDREGLDVDRLALLGCGALTRGALPQ